MPRRADRILATHVGSLIRPPALVEFLLANRGLAREASSSTGVEIASDRSR